jgi:hypothetical protein
VPELVDVLVEVRGHPDTCDFDSEWIPRVLTSLSIRRVETPAR